MANTSSHRFQDFNEAIMTRHSRRGDSTQRNVNSKSYVRAFEVRLMHHKRESSRDLAMFSTSLEVENRFSRRNFRPESRLRNTGVFTTESRFERPWLSILLDLRDGCE